MEKIQGLDPNSVTKTDKEQECGRMSNFIVETIVEVYDPEDWKFKVETTIEVYRPKD